MAGEISLPRGPSISYLLELGGTHLVHDRLLRGSHHVIAGLAGAAQLPLELGEPYLGWPDGGHLGEIAKTAAVLSTDRKLSAAERVQAVHTGAAFVTTLGVTEAVVSQTRPDRTQDNSRRFLTNVGSALLDGPEAEQLMLSDGPEAEAQAAAYRFASAAGRWLKIDNDRKDPLRELLDSWNKSWLEQLAESAPGKRDPEKLLRIAQDLGARVSEMAAVLVLGHKGNPALTQLGAIGGIAEHGGRQIAENGVYSYAAALAEQGASLDTVKGVRDREAAVRYQEAQPHLTTPRQRRVFDTVTWFAMALSTPRRGSWANLVK